MLIFLSALLSCTYGEVEDAFDNELEQEKNNVANIAKLPFGKK